MSMLGVVTVNGHQIIVETEAAPIPVLHPASEALPRDAEFTSMRGRLQDAGQMIRESIGAFAETAVEALRKAAPDECTVEIAISFRGETSPVPVMVKLGGEGSLRVTAKWKKLPSDPA